MKKLKYILSTLIITLLSLNVSAVNCDGYSAWTSGGQSANAYRTYAGSLYQNNSGSNGWDGAGDNPSVNGDWTLIGVCSNDPAVTTQNSSAITSSTMTFNGTVTSNSGFAISDRGFIYGTNQADVEASEIGALVGSSTTVSEGGTTVSTYTKAITGLCPGITYYVMSYATNSEGSGYEGSSISATTSTPGTFTTVQDGAFSSADTWGGCSAPDLTLGHTINIGHTLTSSGFILREGTDVVITTGGTLTNTGTVTLGGSGGITSLTVDAGGTLSTTNIGYSSASVLTTNGTTTITGTLTVDAVGTFNTSGTTTIGTIDNNNGDFNQTAGIVTVTNNYDCEADCDFDQSGGAMDVTGDFKVHGSGESHMDGTLDVGTVIMHHNGYMDGSGVLTYASSDVNPDNSGAYISCVGGVKYDDNGGTAFPDLIASPWDLNNCSTLPVELLSFEVKLVKNTVKIQWVTGSEINNDYFEVQTSKNGVDWETIHVIQGAGNSTDIINYVAYDYKIDNYEVKYYRLKQFDYDGKNETSPIRLVNFGENSFFEAYTSGNNILVKASFSELAVINLYDTQGNSVWIKVLNDENVIEVPIDGLSGGMYFITALIDGAFYSKKILISM
jgi:hypothetical protein